MMYINFCCTIRFSNITCGSFVIKARLVVEIAEMLTYSWGMGRPDNGAHPAEVAMLSQCVPV